MLYFNIKIIPERVCVEGSDWWRSVREKIKYLRFEYNPYFVFEWYFTSTDFAILNCVDYI